MAAFLVSGAGIEPTVSINSHKTALTQRVTPTYKKASRPALRCREGRDALLNGGKEISACGTYARPDRRPYPQ